MGINDITLKIPQTMSSCIVLANALLKYMLGNESRLEKWLIRKTKTTEEIRTTLSTLFNNSAKILVLNILEKPLIGFNFLKFGLIDCRLNKSPPIHKGAMIAIITNPKKKGKIDQKPVVTKLTKLKIIALSSPILGETRIADCIIVIKLETKLAPINQNRVKPISKSTNEVNSRERGI